MTIAENFGTTHRSIADKMLARTLAIGLGGSMLLHTIAIAGVNYLPQSLPDDLEITMVERVEPEPSPAPSTKPIASVVKPIPKSIAPASKPIPAPAPKVVKPIVAAVPSPKPVSIPTPKAIATPAPVVKITQAKVPVKLPTDRLSKFILPQPTRLAKTTASAKDVTNKTVRVASLKENRSQPTTKTPKQSKITNNKPAFGNTSLPSSPLRPSNSNDNLDDNPNGDGSTPGQPGNNNKLARLNETAPSGNNQTGLASSNSNSRNKSPQGLGNTVDSTGSNSPNDEDFGIGSGNGGLPGNNARIANNRSTIAGGGSSNNQIGLGGIRTNSPNIGDGLRTSGGSADGFSSSGGSGDGLGGNGDDFISGAPGNNQRIARGSGGIGHGGNGTGGKGNGNNQTGLGGGNRGNGGGRRNGSTFGSLDGTGNSSSYSNTNGNDEFGSGTPGNVATGSRNQVSIQCLRNCEIRYPDELEASDIGKDKILVKITIAANGSITNAEIARSSGNQNLDRVTLAGVKQMQLSPTGKVQTHRVKISTLLNN